MHTLDPLRLPHPVGSSLLYVPIGWEDTDPDYTGAVDLDHLASSRCLNDSSFLPPLEGFRERNRLCPSQADPFCPSWELKLCPQRGTE